jgi:hypothetical protein
MTSADLHGDLFPPVIYIFSVENWATTGPPPVTFATLFLVTGLVAALSVVAILAVIVIWRRRRGP